MTATTYTGVLLSESLTVGRVLDGVPLDVQRVYRAVAGDVEAGQPEVWTFLEFEVPAAHATPWRIAWPKCSTQAAGTATSVPTTRCSSSSPGAPSATPEATSTGAERSSDTDGLSASRRHSWTGRTDLGVRTPGRPDAVR